MGNIIRTDRYWGIYLDIVFAASPFTAIGEVGHNQAMLRTAMWIMGIAICGTVVCAVFRHRISPPPMILSKLVQDLFIPYTVLLSTAIASIAGVPTALGYWGAFGWTVVVVLADVLSLFPRKR